MNIEVDVSNVNKHKADDRGRVTLGSEYANETVIVAIVEVEHDDAA